MMNFKMTVREISEIVSEKLSYLEKQLEEDFYSLKEIEEGDLREKLKRERIRDSNEWSKTQGQMDLLEILPDHIQVEVSWDELSPIHWVFRESELSKKDGG